MRSIFVLSLLFCAAVFAVQDFEKFTPHFLKSVYVKNNTCNSDSFVETAMIPTRDGINLFNYLMFFPSGASPNVFNTILIHTLYSVELAAPLYAALGQPGFAIVIQVFFCFVFGVVINILCRCLLFNVVCCL